MPDFAERRTVMVDTQVRPNDVTKFPIIEAMLAVPREVFVPEAAVEVAYVGENIEIAPRRVVLEPRTLAKMLDALDICLDDRVLDVGAGLGYSSAVIARMARSVVAVETPDLASGAEMRLTAQGIGNIKVVAGPLADGAAAEGPFDAIAIEGGVEQVPEALVTQLRDGGRIAALFIEGTLGTCRIGHKSDGRISWRFGFNAAAPVLPGFEKHKSFAL